MNPMFSLTKDITRDIFRLVKRCSTAGTVLGNILKAHVKIYQMAKQVNYNSDLKIGIVMSIFLFEPSNRINLMLTDRNIFSR